MSGNVPGVGGTPSNEPTHCPLCNTPVSGNDGLQLHYLTSCSGYDKLNDQPRPKPKKVTRDDPVGVSSSSAVTFGAPLPSTSTSGGGARVGGATTAGFGGATSSASGGGVVSSQDTSMIQFMWQPLTEITYPEVTLLASFEPGSVRLTLDSDGGHYESGRVTIPNGTYEGQLVIGDSFVYPVKKFTVSKTDDIVVLQFDVKPGSGSEGEASYTPSSHYGSGHMQQNPSYSNSSQYGGTSLYSNDSKTGQGVGAAGRYAGHDSQGASGGHTGHDSRGASGGYAGHDSRGASGGYTGHDSRGASGGHAGITNTPGDDGFGYYKGINSSETQSQSYSETSELATRTVAGVSLDKTQTATPGAPDNVQPTSSGPGRSGARPPTNRAGGERLRVASSPPASSVHCKRVAASPAAVVQASSQGAHVDPATEFNVGQLQQVPTEDVRVLRQRLEEVTKERDDLKQNQERVNAHWDGKVNRLKAQLQRANDGNPSTEDNTLSDALDEAQAQVTRLERELDSMKGQQSEAMTASRNSSELERQLSELKDRNTALEQQLVEYAGTISDQTKYIHSTVAGSKAQDAEALKTQQELIHITTFAKKQQLEQAESLASLKKQISSAGSFAGEMIQLRQMNVSLTGELEDYRTQTRRLLEDLRQKEEEIGELKGALSERGPLSTDKAQLEIATMQEKLIAWQQEFEKLAPLKDEVEQLRDHVSQQEQELGRLTEDNDVLTGQMQSMIDENKKMESELYRKANDYDTLMGRLTDLQQTRVSLENELQPLREERASTLRENAHLREGSDPQNYAKLKVEYESLITRCQQLESTVSKQDTLLSAHQDTNFEMQSKLSQATDPEKLNSIRIRMDRYKQERDTARLQTEELSTQLALREVEKQEALEQLQQTTEQSQRLLTEFQSKVSQQDDHITRLSQYETRMRKYREERENLRVRCKDLQKQVDNWKGLVTHSHQNQAQVAPSLNVEYDQTDDNLSSLSPTHDQPVSPLAEYHPSAYTEDQHQHDRESVGSPLNELERGFGSLTLEQSKPQPRKRTSSGSHSGRKTGLPYDMVDVKTKEGSKTVYVQRCRGELNAKSKPKVIVKRGEVFEQGTLMFVGLVNDKELAGIHMDCRVIINLSTGVVRPNDGTCTKDGRRYFKCPIGYGLYVPVSKVYLEMDSACV